MGDRWRYPTMLGPELQLDDLWYVHQGLVKSVLELIMAARVFNGIGTGILNAVTPVWATETASHISRGKSVWKLNSCWLQ